MPFKNMAGRPRIYESPEEMSTAIEEYFNDAVKPTVTGLALHLGFDSKQSLYDYRERPEFSYPIKRALTMIENYHEGRLSENSVTGSIFALKNMGWKDKTETDITSQGERLNQIEVTVVTGQNKHSLSALSGIEEKDNG